MSRRNHEARNRSLATRAQVPRPSEVVPVHGTGMAFGCQGARTTDENERLHAQFVRRAKIARLAKRRVR